MPCEIISRHLDCKMLFFLMLEFGAPSPNPATKAGRPQGRGLSTWHGFVFTNDAQPIQSCVFPQTLEPVLPRPAGGERDFKPLSSVFFPHCEKKKLEFWAPSPNPLPQGRGLFAAMFFLDRTTFSILQSSVFPSVSVHVHPW